MRPPRSLRALATGAVLAVVLVCVGPLAPASGAAASTGRCTPPPLTVTVLPGPIGTSGPAELAVTDAVARRVPIVPRPADARRDPATVERLRAAAARTDLALYTMYLADFPIPRRELRGSGFGEVTAPEGKTVAAMTIVPTRKRGFRKGDVAEVAPFAYESTTTFAPVSLVTDSSGKRSSYAYDGVTGGVEVRALTAKSICLDLDVTFTYGGRPIASAKGTVEAPVVRAGPSFFYT